MDHEGNNIVHKLITDFFFLLALGTPLILYQVIGSPYKRGFFCNDESINHPYIDSTVPSWSLYIYGLAFPVILVIITEYKRQDNTKPIIIKNYKIPYWFWTAYCVIAVFGFGAICSQLTTDTMKYSVGRLRPHFFTVCQPSINCTQPENQYKYHIDFDCTSGASARKLSEMRLSFPSGHSSFSMYTMFWVAIYVQARWTCKRTFVLKNTVQYLCILLAIWTGMTRISDYKHHWSDVLTGQLLGILAAVLVGVWVGDLFSYRKNRQMVATNDPEIQLPTKNGTPSQT